MLFGNTDSISIEIHHEPEGPEWIGFGRMCIYIQGLVLGDITEDHCSLFHAVERIYEVSLQLDDLWDDRFIGHTPEEIFSWIDAVIYSGDIVDCQDRTERFDFLTNTGEQFDGCKSFVYCEPMGKVYVPFRNNYGTLFEPSCEKTEFRTVAGKLQHWFLNETKR